MRRLDGHLLYRSFPCTILISAGPRRSLSFSFSATTIYAHRLHAMAKPVTLTIPATGRKIAVPTGLFINNEFVSSVDSTETIQCVLSAGRSPFAAPAKALRPRCAP